MARTPAIEENYINEVIKAAEPFDPTLNKTQGIKLRELVSKIVEHFKGEDEYVTGLMTDLNAVLSQQLANKQENLINGSNIKTVNGQSILGSGNVNIGASESFAGTYVPGHGGSENTSSVTQYSCTYTVVGNIVTVYGAASVAVEYAGYSMIRLRVPHLQISMMSGHGSSDNGLAKNIRIEFGTQYNAQLSMEFDAPGQTLIYFSFQYFATNLLDPIS